jgi:hypothetical protein
VALMAVILFDLKLICRTLNQGVMEYDSLINIGNGYIEKKLVCYYH